MEKTYETNIEHYFMLWLALASFAILGAFIAKGVSGIAMVILMLCCLISGVVVGGRILGVRLI